MSPGDRKFRRMSFRGVVAELSIRLRVMKTAVNLPYRLNRVKLRPDLADNDAFRLKLFRLIQSGSAIFG